MKLYNDSNCVNVDDWTWSFLAVKPEALTEKYHTPEDQLFFCTQAEHELVVGVFPNVQEPKLEILLRDDFVGVLKDEYVPTWAYKKIQENNPLGMTLKIE